MAVVALRGFSVAEHHTRRYWVGALNVGVVEALYMARLTVKTEVETHPLHQALGVPSGVSTFEIPEHINLILSRIFLADCQ